jgi:hypothetical protein
VKLNLNFNKMIERMSALSKNIVMHKNIEEISVSDKKAATLGMILVNFYLMQSNMPSSILKKERLI